VVVDVDVDGWVAQVALDFADVVGKTEEDAAGQDGKDALGDGGANAAVWRAAPVRRWIAKNEVVFIMESLFFRR